MPSAVLAWNSQAAEKNYAEEDFLARLPVTGSDVHGGEEDVARFWLVLPQTL